MAILIFNIRRVNENVFDENKLHLGCSSVLSFYLPASILFQKNIYFMCFEFELVTFCDLSIKKTF